MISLYEFLVKDKKKMGYQTVDFDLPSGTQWATCNIGGDKPEDYGLLFQWGRIDGYKYDDKNYKFLSKDDYVTTSGTEYKSNETLKPEDDAAYQATNGKLRMPTVDEINELLKHTNNELTKLNGVKGVKFISKNDDKKWIFIPAAGGFGGSNDSFFYVGEAGYLWSSSVNHDFNDMAYHIFFNNYGRCNSNSNDCCSGFSVRGVLNK